MIKTKYAGRRLTFWGSLSLLVLAGWELYSRFDTVLWTLRGVLNISRSEGIPFLRVLSNFDPSMFELLFFLLGCALFSILGVLLRNRPRAGAVLIPAAAALAALGGIRFGWFTQGALVRIQSLKALPILMIALGCAVSLIHFFALRRRKQDEKETVKPGECERAA